MSLDYWKREALRWLDDASEDLRVAEDLLRNMHHAASCFHSQQAAEKAVKAALYSNRVEAGGHSILELLEGLERVSNSELKELYNNSRLLDRHYAPPRYPNLHPSVSLPSYKLYSEEDAERCIKSAKKS
ncbi:MAG: HEPN domain-containing protein [Candidatus Bathyarchaeia archaeon]